MKTKTIDKNGELYVGEVNLMGQPHGHGTLTFKYSGGKYEGEFRKGKPHGFGKYTASDGYSFEGSWDNGIEVEGRLICVNGDIYEGRMRSKGERVYGVMIYADGEIYEGEWLGTDRDGKATVTLPDGSRYERVYKNDKVVSSKQIVPPTEDIGESGGEPQEDIGDNIDKHDRNVLTAIRRAYELAGEEAFAPGGKAPALLSDLLPGDSYSKERRRIKKAVNCGAAKLLFRVKNEGSAPELHCAEANRLLIDQEDMSEEAADLLVAQLLAGLFAVF